MAPVSALRVNPVVCLTSSLAVFSLALPAIAAEAPEAPQDSGEAKNAAHATPHQYINLRGGASSANLNGRPEVCMEGTPWAPLSVESCGTGNGLWHHDSGTEMAHLRVKLQLFALRSGPLVFQYGVGAGMAELQVAADDPGFKFGGTGPRQAETAGAEGSLFLRAVYPLSNSFELVGDLQTGSAYLPYAPELSVPKSVWQPFVGLTVGFGY